MKNTSMSLVETMAFLGRQLDGWTFQQYGKGQAIACYPPTPISRESWDQLACHAFISSVCGPLYVVTALRDPIHPARPFPN